MMSGRFHLLSIVLTLVLVSAASAISTTTYDLRTPSVSGNQVRLPVWATFTPDTLAEELVEFQIDVAGSDSALTAAGTDFSRFSFDLDDPLEVVGWFALSDFTAGGTDLADSRSQQTTFNTGLPGSTDPYFLGDIVVDVTGLAGQSLFVVINGPETAAASVDPQTFDFIDNEVDFVSARQQFQVPDAPPPGVIPEPATAVLVPLGLLALAVGSRRRRCV